MKATWPKLKVFAVEPAKIPVLSGGEPGPHPIQGIGAGFIPKILKKALLDGVIQVEHTDAFEMARRAAKEEGLFVGGRSGASLAAVKQKLPDMPAGSRVLTFVLRHRRALPVGGRPLHLIRFRVPSADGQA